MSRVHFVTLGGFLGAGKTTTMLAAAERLTAAGRRVVVITNDQGADLVDTAMARAHVSTVAEVTGGCFCCRFDELAATTLRLIEEQRADMVVAEAVGSCADLQATVIRPLCTFLGDRLQVAPLTVLVDPLRYADFTLARAAGDREADLEYLFRKQLEEADILALNKVDLLSSDELQALCDTLQAQFHRVTLVKLSARTGTGIDELLRQWGNVPRSDADLDLDYEKYGRAEHCLAWANLVLGLQARGPKGVAIDDWIEEFLATIGDRCRTGGHSIGHVKVLVVSKAGTVKASLVSSARPTLWDGPRGVRPEAAEVVVNARVVADPAVLGAMLVEATSSCSARAGAAIELRSTAVFSPAQPVPVHRLRA